MRVSVLNFGGDKQGAMGCLSQAQHQDYLVSELACLIVPKLKFQFPWKFNFRLNTNRLFQAFVQEIVKIIERAV